MLVAVAINHLLLLAALALIDYHYLCLWHVRDRRRIKERKKVGKVTNLQ
jgi:hypothetical protein